MEAAQSGARGYHAVGHVRRSSGFRVCVHLHSDSECAQVTRGARGSCSSHARAHDVRRRQRQEGHLFVLVIDPCALSSFGKAEVPGAGNGLALAAIVIKLPEAFPQARDPARKTPVLCLTLTSSFAVTQPTGRQSTPGPFPEESL